MLIRGLKLILGALVLLSLLGCPQTQGTFTLDLEGSNGQVRVNGTLQTLPWDEDFAAGTVVNLEAVADTGFTFDSWGGDLTGTNPTTTITMSADRSVTANWSEPLGLDHG